MPENASAPDTQTQTEAPWSPEEAVKTAQQWRSEFSVDGDQIMLRGRVPVWLEREIADPSNYTTLHAHLTEIARQRAERAAEKARQQAEDDWAAQFQYDGRNGWKFNRAGELAKIRKELERRMVPAKTKAAKK